MVAVVIVSDRISRWILDGGSIDRLGEGQFESCGRQPHSKNVHRHLAGPDDSLQSFGRSPDSHCLSGIEARAVGRKCQPIVARSEIVAVNKNEAGALILAADFFEIS